jgi:F420-0:gamma-glutamyl ligase
MITLKKIVVIIIIIIIIIIITIIENRVLYLKVIKLIPHKTDIKLETGNKQRRIYIILYKLYNFLWRRKQILGKR